VALAPPLPTVGYRMPPSVTTAHLTLAVECGGAAVVTVGLLKLPLATLAAPCAQVPAYAHTASRLGETETHCGSFNGRNGVSFFDRRHRETLYCEAAACLVQK
jgi:hypothetical protein